MPLGGKDGRVGGRRRGVFSDGREGRRLRRATRGDEVGVTLCLWGKENNPPPTAGGNMPGEGKSMEVRDSTERDVREREKIQPPLAPVSDDGRRQRPLIPDRWELRIRAAPVFPTPTELQMRSPGKPPGARPRGRPCSAFPRSRACGHPPGAFSPKGAAAEMRT